MNKWILTLLLAALGSLSATVQANTYSQHNTKASLDAQVTRAVTQQVVVKQSKTQSEPGNYEPLTSDDQHLSPRELIEAEEELSHIRNRMDDNATFEKYPYLLDPSYRHTHNSNGDMVSVVKEPLSPREQIEAEEELSHIRNRIDTHATFEKYPYLLNPAYRRADSQQQQSMRRPYTQKTWARKVGL